MIRRPPRSTQGVSSAASDVYKRQELTESIEKVAVERNMQVLGRVPFDTIFVKSMVKGVNIFEYEEDSPTQQAVRDIWQKIVSAPCLLYTSPSPRDLSTSRMPSSA
eukprot:TRINITY_DN26641_c0_g1_i3.p2 TRINITY_DN26641_c0_g1~~TRINITY_DN26641_c0_g1_i3.p2  ORF type:complete len:106 (+),score=27.93 TRINITY_DN26641_c0_g1_i3:82-399(+)